MPEPGVIDRAALTVNHWFWQAVDLVYPPVCISCGKAGERWCDGCQAQVKRVGRKVCQKCGARISQRLVCVQCSQQEPLYSGLRSYGWYQDPLRQAILRIKYQRDLGLGEILAGFIMKLVEEQGWQFEGIVPVPLSPDKLKQRGYNQVELFTRPLAWSLGLPYLDRALKRVRQDTSQVHLTAENRRSNVSEAFQVGDPALINGKRILLVDDVATTGSTADVCSQVLMSGGALQVWVATLARSMLRKSVQEVPGKD